MTLVALAGGVGGAKLAHGLARVLPPESLTVAVNTGDDFVHLGLQVCPDLDTVMYTLAGLSNPLLGWGQAGESWHFMESLERLGGETWFRLGDRDLATHIRRTTLLGSGRSLSDVTAELCRSLGVAQRIVPMSDDPVRTVVESDRGELAFQDYFVRQRCEPVVRGLRYEGAPRAHASPGWLQALHAPGLQAIVLCPSNPYLSIAPMLAIPGVAEAMRASAAPVVAVSPIVGGEAVKGPAAKIMRELGREATALEVARHYGRLIDGFVLDHADAPLAAQVQALGIAPLVTSSVMRTDADRERLARDVCRFAATLDRRARTA